MTVSVPETGAPAPDFTLMDHDDVAVSLADYRGRWLVLYFYPKDGTGGCTLEAVEFSRLAGGFQGLNATVAGVSRDSTESHRRFIGKNGLSVRLLSDPGHSVHESYGAWRRKVMYGKESMGAARSTFLIAPDGMIAHSWPNVKAAGHAAQVLARLRELAGG